MTLREKAYKLAEEAHKGQKYGEHPYMYHIHDVVKVAEGLGYGEIIIIACILHDTIEDTHITYDYLVRDFGKEIADIVYSVTDIDDKTLNRKQRKLKTYPKTRANWKGVVVKICDRISNVRNAILNNSKLLKMYIKEHDDFCKYLKSDEHPSDVDIAWKKLSEYI